jgi:hypothetical protein
MVLLFVCDHESKVSNNEEQFYEAFVYLTETPDLSFMG